jgi:hypothetical protein
MAQSHSAKYGMFEPGRSMGYGRNIGEGVIMIATDVAKCSEIR